MPDNKKIVTYCCGWPGDNYAKECTEFFHDCLKSIDLTDLFILITFHPRGNGDFEESLFSDISNARVIKKFTTEDCVAASDAVLCAKSTVAPKVIAAGVKVIHIVHDPDYSNPVIDCGLAPLITNVEDFKLRFWAEIVDSHIDLKLFYKKMKMPEFSKEEYVQTLIWIKDLGDRLSANQFIGG